MFTCSCNQVPEIYFHIYPLTKRSFKGFLLNVDGDATWIALSGSPGWVPHLPTFPKVLPKFTMSQSFPEFPFSNFL